MLISIHENVRELHERRNFADPDERTHIEAKIIAYNEILSILRASADTSNLPKDEIGL